MATTRTPLPPAEPQELFHTVGCHVYLLRYPKGQEDLARECIYRWVRNRDLEFEWGDAATMAEQLPDPPELVDDDCDCDLCRSFPLPSPAAPAGLYRWTVAFLTLVVAWLAWRGR